MKTGDQGELPRSPDEGAVTIESPSVDDGPELLRLADESGVLDVNSPYSYLLWCRDFAATSVVARLARPDGASQVVGFVTGYRRPDEPSTLFVWQVALAAAAQGRGVAGQMLDTLFDQIPGVDRMETTVTPDNKPSIRMFTAFAERRGAAVDVRELFGAGQFAPGHEPENLYRIGPITRTTS